jgi:hypothetical protein
MLGKTVAFASLTGLVLVACSHQGRDRKRRAAEEAQPSA